MIICHKYKFIYLKSSKTAGTSMEIALSKFCGDQDVLSPLGTEHENLRRGLGYCGAQNYLAPVTDYRFRDIARLFVRARGKTRFYHHISAKEVQRYVGVDIWNSYYKFCFERNPWDRVISWYYWRWQSEPRPTLAEFIDSNALEKLRKTGFELYSIDGRVAVDRVFLFENLQEDLEKLRDLLGLPETPSLPRAGSIYRKDKRHYRDILNGEQKERIASIFSKEIGLFGYEF